MSRLVFATVLICLPLSSAAAGPKFIDQSSHLPVDHQYSGGWEHFVGGGVAVFDCNGDAMPEILAAGGSDPTHLLINTTLEAGADLRFALADPQPILNTGVIGVYPIEIDGDGVGDLAVLRVGENQLLRGLGDCTYEAANDIWQFDGLDRWTTAFSATWEREAEFPTLAFGNYVDREDPDGPFKTCDDNHLYKPDGAGFGAAMPLSPGFCALSLLFSDWGRQGVQDLRISNDRHYFVSGGQEQLWRISPNPTAYTEADGWNALSIWGMGIASRDLTGDGRPEVFLTSMGDQKLRHLSKGGDRPDYANAAYDSGTTAHVPYVGGEGRPSTGWHAVFGDVDNDGLEDLFITKGNVNQMPDAALRDPNNLLMQIKTGTFVEHGDHAGLDTTERSRGGALVDLNADGLLDVVVNNRRAGLELHQNISKNVGQWLALRPQQPAPNTDAIGGWIELTDGQRTWHREITIGGGHGGGTLGYHHFGTGSETSLKMRVLWPDGAQGPWHIVEAGQFIDLTRGSEPQVVINRN
ncbi:MAG: VCBS repeat-containing protein [Pseudoruegeria sp.]